VAEGKKTATIEIDVTEKEGSKRAITLKTEIRVENGQDVLFKKEPKDHTPRDLLVCGYGVARQMEGDESVRSYRILDSVYTMFVYNASLVGTELTLRRLRDYLGIQAFNGTLGGIKRAIGLSASDRIILPRGGGVTISGPSIGKEIPIEGWADGFRKTLGWILDLYAWAMRAGRVTRAGGIRGILLIDEVEQHLHPSMQTKLLTRLRDLFPELQIIATTHSPLVALGAEPRSVVVLKRSGKRVVRESVPNFTMYSVEDMLADPEIFDSPVYRPETDEKLAHYRELAAKSPQGRNAKQKAELGALAEELAAQQIPEVHESPAIRKLNQLLNKHNL
jgi:AAA domain, putative AbiEii toxin, Type IV TA system